MNQIRCHINNLTTTMMNTIEVPNDDGKNFGGAETKFNVTKGKEPVKVFPQLFFLISLFGQYLILI